MKGIQGPVSENWPTMEEVERRHIVETLLRTSYNQSAAARLLGMTRKVLSGKIRRYAIRTDESRRGRPAGS